MFSIESPVDKCTLTSACHIFTISNLNSALLSPCGWGNRPFLCVVIGCNCMCTERDLSLLVNGSGNLKTTKTIIKINIHDCPRRIGISGYSLRLVSLHQAWRGRMSHVAKVGGNRWLGRNRAPWAETEYGVCGFFFISGSNALNGAAVLYHCHRSAQLCYDSYSKTDDQVGDENPRTLKLRLDIRSLRLTRVLAT